MPPLLSLTISSEFLLAVNIGGEGNTIFPKYTDAMNNTLGNFKDKDTSPHGPMFFGLHALLDMFLRKALLLYNDYASTTWGFLYKNAVKFFVDVGTYQGINGDEIINSAWPIYWMDVGWAEPGSPDAMNEITHAQAHCALAKENAPYIYVCYSGAPDSAPGEVVDNSTLSPSSTLTSSPTSGGITRGMVSTTLLVAVGIASYSCLLY
jgi:hypothetical protein